MQKVLLSLLIFITVCSCNKVKIPPAKVQSVQSVADAMGLKFEMPYKLTIVQNIEGAFPDTVSDTIIFHPNDTVTEIYNGVTYSYFCHYGIGDAVYPCAFGDTLKDNNFFIMVPESAAFIPSLFYRFNGGIMGTYITGQICENNKPTLGIRLNDNRTDKTGFYYSYAHITQ